MPSVAPDEPFPEIAPLSCFRPEEGSGIIADTQPNKGGDMTTDQSTARFTLRAVLVGAFISILMGILAPYSRYVLHTTPLVFSSFSWGVASSWVLFLVVDAYCARGRGLWRPFNPAEMALVFIIPMIAASLTTHEVAGLMVTNIGGLPYHASPENRYYELFAGLFPAHLIPTDRNHAVAWLFDGVPPGMSPSWGDWAVPVFWHMSFAAAMYVVQFSLVALLRKHWVEHERLTFPILQIPIELARTAPDGGWVPPWAKNTLFWYGFAIPFVMLMLQMLNWFFPAVPVLKTDLGTVELGREFGGLRMQIFWPVIAISFFANTEVIFSLWFFKLVAQIATGVVHRIGLVTTAGTEPMQWLNAGALIVMVAWFMWQARRHLKLAFRRAIGKEDGEDDAGEFVTYRTAYLMLLGGVLYMLFWLMQIGTSAWIALLLIILSQTIFLGIARVAFEAGVFHVNAPLHSCQIIVEGIGPLNLARETLGGLANVFWKFTNVKSLFLVAMGHAGGLSSMKPMQFNRRRLSPVLAIMVPLTTLVAVWYTMYLGFSMGGYNFGEWIFGNAPLEPYEALKKWIENPQPVNGTHVAFFGVGAGLMAFFTGMRYVFVGWPIHPIGLALCFSYHIGMSFLSFLIAWAVKASVMRFGGISLYNKTKPLFLGVLLGAFAGGIICLVVDAIWFPLAGHAVFYK